MFAQLSQVLPNRRKTREESICFVFEIKIQCSNKIYSFNLLICHFQVIIDQQDMSFLWKIESEEGNVFLLYNRPFSVFF